MEVNIHLEGKLKDNSQYEHVRGLSNAGVFGKRTLTEDEMTKGNDLSVNPNVVDDGLMVDNLVDE